MQATAAWSMSFGTRSSASSEGREAAPVAKPAGKRKKSLHAHARLQSKKSRSQNTSAESIKIIVRVRPITEKEISAHDGSALVVSERKACVAVQERQYTFDQVFDQHSSQEHLFEAVGKPIVDGCLNGANGSIFAYGQTGSGKTYTMVGSDSFASRGVIPRVLEYLFSQITAKQQNGDIINCSVACSFLEIYKENISDLLVEVPDVLPVEMLSGKKSLQIRQDNAKRVYVENLTETNVSSVAQAQQLLAAGGKRKKVSKTNMNDTSSRSHTVFTLVVTCSLLAEGTLQKQTSRLNLVDLAGSESQRAAGTAGERLKEGSKINQSLSALGNVIMALARTAKGGNKRKVIEGASKASKPFHIPYRDSKLTWLLKDSLGGSAKTFVIANVSPAISCVQETVSTLNFALRAKEVENKVILNKGIIEAELAPEVQSYIAEIRSGYQGEISSLQEELEELRASVGKAAGTGSFESISSELPVSCQCHYGADVLELANFAHQMQLHLYEARQEISILRKQLQSSNAVSVLPFASPSKFHKIATPASIAIRPFVSCTSPLAATSSSSSSLASVFSEALTSSTLSSVSTSSSTSSAHSHSPSTPFANIVPKLRPSARGAKSEPTAFVSHNRVPTPMILRNRREVPRSASSLPLDRLRENEEGEKKQSQEDEEACIQQRLVYHSTPQQHLPPVVYHITPQQQQEQQQQLEKILQFHSTPTQSRRSSLASHTLLEQLSSTPPLMHTSYQVSSGGTQSVVTHVSPLFTRTSVSPPSHFKFDSLSPSPSKSHNVSLTSSNDNGNNNNDNNGNHVFTFHSPVESTISPHPYRLRSADKLQEKKDSPHLIFHPTPSPNKYKTLPSSSLSFSQETRSATNPHLVKHITPATTTTTTTHATSGTPSRMPFSPLKPCELRAPSQRQEVIQLNPVNRLEDYFQEENAEPQKISSKESVVQKMAPKGGRSLVAAPPIKKEKHCLSQTKSAHAQVRGLVS